MKILFAGDLHLFNKIPISRLDDYPQTMLNKLKMILDIPSDYYIFSGDWFHTPDVSKEYTAKVIEVLQKYQGKNIYTVIGNHDTNFGKTENIENSSLGIIFATGFVRRLTTVLVDDWSIYGCDYDQVPPIPEQDKNTILVAHKYYLENDAKEQITDEEADRFDFVFLGHEHQPKQFERNIFRIGSVSRMTGSKENTERDYFSVLLFDTETTKVQEKKFQVPDVFNKVFLDIRREMKKELKMNMDKIFETVQNETLEKVLALPNFNMFSDEVKQKFLELYNGL